MNLTGWIMAIFAAHVAVYYFWGTDNWLGTAALATIVWAAALYGIRYFLRGQNKAR